jgi:NADH:ubiquinone oxidoreductase subunit 3 (subunit A)
MATLVKDIILVIIMIALVWLAFYLGSRHDTLDERVQHYDCGLTEFEPVPSDIRSACREQRLQELNQRP